MHAPASHAWELLCGVGLVPSSQGDSGAQDRWAMSIDRGCGRPRTGLPSSLLTPRQSVCAPHTQCNNFPRPLREGREPRPVWGEGTRRRWLPLQSSAERAAPPASAFPPPAPPSLRGWALVLGNVSVLFCPGHARVGNMLVDCVTKRRCVYVCAGGGGSVFFCFTGAGPLCPTVWSRSGPGHAVPGQVAELLSGCLFFLLFFK